MFLPDEILSSDFVGLTVLYSLKQGMEDLNHFNFRFFIKPLSRKAYSVFLFSYWYEIVYIIQLLTMDILVLATMKNAAKCDT